MTDMNENNDTPADGIGELIQELGALCGVAFGDECKAVVTLVDNGLLIELDGPEASVECKFIIKIMPTLPEAVNTP